MSIIVPGLLMLIPLAGALAILVMPGGKAKWVAAAFSALALGYNIVLAILYQSWGTSEFGFAAQFEWLKLLNISFSLGIDSVSMLLVLLTTLMSLIAIVGAFSDIKKRRREFYAWMLVLEAAMIGVFIARDLILFYICFEVTLIPMFFLIAIYGGKNRGAASVKFFIYTFTGSILALAGLLYVVWSYALAHNGQWNFSIEALTNYAALNLTALEQGWVLAALLAGFAVKIPVFPVHTWLPLAHTEAPTAGSVILAAILLKLGTYGVYRFVLPMLPEGVVNWAPIIAIFALIGILYAALICWVQTDVKRLVAYSSVSHLGFCVLGLIALNPMGLDGAVLYMINHGLSTGALFLLVGMMYERYHTRDMGSIGGLARLMPLWSFFMVFFVLASVGLPGLNGFVSEFLCLIGTYAANADAVSYPGVLGPWYAAIAVLGIVLAAMYLLIMVGKVVFGPVKTPMPKHDDSAGLSQDLNAREIGVLVPLAALCIFIGVQPSLFTDAIAGSVESTLARYPETVRKERVANQRQEQPVVLMNQWGSEVGSLRLLLVQPETLRKEDQDG